MRQNLEFEFDFYVAPVENLLDTIKNFNFQGVQGEKALYIVIGVAAFVAILLITCIVCLVKKCRNSNNKIEVTGTVQAAAPQHELASGDFSAEEDIDL